MAADRRLWQFARMQTTDDGFLGGKLRILQPKKGFRAGVDSVFLAASVPARPGDRVVEAGTGPGVAALCLLSRVAGLHLTGIEREPPSASLARENAARNGLALEVIEADITSGPILPPESFAHGFANPPWFENHAATHSPHALKARAHALASGDMALWIANLGAMIMQGGSLTFIHRWQEGQAIAALMAQGGYGGIAIKPILARQGETPIRAIVQGWKGRGNAMKVLENFVLHEGGANDFTQSAQAILRQGAGLEF